MTDKPRVPAIEGWHTMDETPTLLGSRCRACGTYFFPKQTHFCRNPACESTEFDEVALSRTGRVWSYTNACYTPPEPYVPADPFEPFAIAAVELEQERMVVLGQVAAGITIDELQVGMPVELVLEPLHETDEAIKVTWKWRPLAGGEAR